MACKGTSLPKLWWRDSQLLREEIDHHGGATAVGQAHGLSQSTVSSWARRHGFPKDTPGTKPPPPVSLVPGDHDDAWLLAALKKAKDNATVEDLADYADVSPKRVREALERLGHDGYRVEENADRVVLRRVPPSTENVHKALFDGERYRFGIVSDTHLSSKHERLDELNLSYDMFVDEGITDVYHPGDFTCGIGIFPGQVNEIQNHTYGEQVQYLVDNYPVRDGITTFGVGGNHDLEGEFGRAGANPVVAFANQRPDIAYLGDYHATVELAQGTRINLLHPKGSMGYAMDYKARKLVEGFEGGRKPNLLLCGHFHRAGWIYARSVHVLFTACFESGGAFGPRLGLPDPAVGSYVVDMTVADDGSVVRFEPEFRPFFPGRSVKVAA